VIPKRFRVFIVAVITSSLFAVGAQPSSASQEDDKLSSIARATFTSISSCLAPADAQLNVLYLLDASSSLEEDHDPQRLRGPILAQAISQLGSVAENRPVYFAVSSFDRDYQVRRDWERLSTANVSEASEWAKNQYSWWGTGLATNWLAALKGGQATMQQAPKPEETGAPVCQVMIWFTDGGINVTRKSDFAANANAMTEICGRDAITNQPVADEAIMDSIRSSGIHLVGVLLQDQGYLDSISEAELKDETSRLSFMRPITEGQGLVDNFALTAGEGSIFEYDCGRIPVPNRWATGALLRGNNPFSLAYAFSDLTAAIQGIQGEGQDLGPTFPATFVIEPGVNFMIIQLAGTEWALTAPNGETVATRDSQPRTSDIEINQQEELTGITVQGAALPPGQWTIDVKSSRDDLMPSARLYRTIKVAGQIQADGLQAGELGEITIAFTDEVTRTPVRQGVYSVSEPVLNIIQGSRPPERLTCSLVGSDLTFVCPFTPAGPGEIQIDGRVDFSDKSGKFQTIYTTRLEDRYPVAAAPGFPLVSPDLVILSDLDGRRGMAKGQITLVGPAEGSGEVCFPEESSIRVVSDAVNRASGYRYTGPWGGSCIALDQGESLPVDISVTNETAASTTVELAFDVELRSNSVDRVESQQVTIQFDTIRQGSPPPWLVVTLFLVGLLIPVALLYAQARAASKLSLGGLQTAVIPVTLDTSSGRVSIARQQPGDQQLFQLDDWQWLPSAAKRPRSFNSADGVVLKARVPKSPVGPLTAEAIAPTGSRLITSEQGYGSITGAVGRFGLMPANQWFIVAKDADLVAEGSSFPATLVGFANPTGGSLSEVSRNMSMSAQDINLIGSWESIRQQMLSSTSIQQAAEFVTPPSDADPSDGFRDVQSPPAGGSTALQSPTTTQPVSPFDEIIDDRTAPPRGSNPPPSSSPPTGVDDPFKDL